MQRGISDLTAKWLDETKSRLKIEMTPAGAQAVTPRSEIGTMNDTKRKFGLKHGLGIVVALALVVGLAIAYVIASGLADRWARRTIVEQLEKTTGARVELGNFHFGWRLLTRAFRRTHLARTRAGGNPASVSRGRLQFDIHVESFWGRKISLGNVEMSHFSAHVRVEKDGSTNIPGPKIRVSAGKRRPCRACSI